MKLQSQLSVPKPITFAYKFFDALFEPMRSVFHHCGSLDLQAFIWNLIFFLYLLIYSFLLIEYHSRQTEQTA